MSSSPAARVPTMAPTVFAAYRRPKARLSSVVRARWRVRLGNVAPMRIVAGARARTANTRRMTASSWGFASSEG
jgi:hypothetical protein